MGQYFRLGPEVAGGLGAGTVMDSSVHPPHVSRLQFELQGWLGDELLETFPCYVVSGAAGDTLRAASLTGFRLTECEVILGDEFLSLYPGRTPPSLLWLQVTGEAGVADFGLSKDHVLVVSDVALRKLREHRLEHCYVDTF